MKRTAALTQPVQTAQPAASADTVECAAFSNCAIRPSAGTVVSYTYQAFRDSRPVTAARSDHRSVHAAFPPSSADVSAIVAAGPARAPETGRSGAASQIARRLRESLGSDSGAMMKADRGVSQMENFKMKWFGCVLGAALIGAVAIPATQASAAGLTIKERLAAQRAAASDKSSTRSEGTRGFDVIKRSTVTASPAATAEAAPAMATSPGVSVKAPTRTAPAVQTAAAAPTAPAITSDEAAVTQASVKRIETKDSTGEAITVNVFATDAGVDISEPVRFEYNSAFLTEEGRNVLKVYCSAIKEFEQEGSDGGSYVLIGHADASGDARYNKVLSQKRAEESRRYMVESCGLPGDRLRAVGLGEEALKDPNNPNAAENRRVELQIGS
jgi:OOP family OmpA-OmpF porin